MAFLLFLVVSCLLVRLLLCFSAFTLVFTFHSDGLHEKKTAHDGLNHGRGVKVIRRKCATRQPDVRQVRM